jgi:hypothetical protein
MGPSCRLIPPARVMAIMMTTETTETKTLAVTMEVKQGMIRRVEI